MIVLSEIGKLLETRRSSEWT